MKEEVKNGRDVEEDKYGTIRWYKNGKLHREDSPAYESPDGVKEWWLNGQRHREDGPAIEQDDGSKEWYLNGIEYTEEEYNQWLKKKLLNENLLATLEEKPSVKKVKI